MLHPCQHDSRQQNTNREQYTKSSSVQIVRRHQEFQAHLRRDIHIGNIGLAVVFLVVKEVFADFLEDDATACKEALLAMTAAWTQSILAAEVALG